MTVSDTDGERKHFTAAGKVIGRIFQAKERTADARNAAVERDLLAPFFFDLDDQIDIALFFVGSLFNVLFRIDRVEVLSLIQALDRDAQIIVIVDIAFVEKELAPHHLVTRKCISDELKPAKRELFALIDRYLDIDNTFVRIRGIVLEFGLELGVVLNESLRSVNFFQIFVNNVLKPLSVGDVACFEADI